MLLRPNNGMFTSENMKYIYVKRSDSFIGLFQFFLAFFIGCVCYRASISLALCNNWMLHLVWLCYMYDEPLQSNLLQEMLWDYVGFFWMFWDYIVFCGILWVLWSFIHLWLSFFHWYLVSLQSMRSLMVFESDGRLGAEPSRPPASLSYFTGLGSEPSLRHGHCFASHTLAHTQTHIHTCNKTHTHTHPHTCTHTQTHMHTYTPVTNTHTIHQKSKNRAWTPGTPTFQIYDTHMHTRKHTYVYTNSFASFTWNTHQWRSHQLTSLLLFV